jgi:hypothetical protein
LRDWIKGQVTAIECGILKFEAVFMPYMLRNQLCIGELRHIGRLAPGTKVQPARNVARAGQTACY